MTNFNPQMNELDENIPLIIRGVDLGQDDWVKTRFLSFDTTKEEQFLTHDATKEADVKNWLYGEWPEPAREYLTKALKRGEITQEDFDSYCRSHNNRLKEYTK